MTPREIIAQAWAITTAQPMIRRWSFTSSFFETLLDLKLFIYQGYFLYKYLHGGEAGFFDIEIAIYHSMPFWVFASFIIFLVLLVTVELFIPHLCLGAIIGLAAKAKRKDEMKGGLVLGLYNFFAIFAIHEFLVLASLPTVTTVTSVILRYIDGPIKWYSIIILTILFVFSSIMRFLFSFANQGVVIEKLSIFKAMGKSLKLIVSHLSHVMFLMLLLVVISIRILLNFATIILVPAIVIGIAYLLTQIFSPVLSYSIAGAIGIAMTLGASYFLAYLHAFKHTVWTITYLELIKQKDLDVIL
jgi:hypothetical protein